MSDSCQTAFDGMSEGYRRALWAVIGINGAMFIVEILAGMSAQSQALKADALDFAGDTVTYALSLFVIGASVKARALASMFKAATLGAMALTVLTLTVLQFTNGAQPTAQTMGIVGVIALVANLLSVVILLRWRDGDSNVRSVWLCSRNDAIGNVGVIAAGVLVAATGTAWPDLIVATLLASLFLRSSVAIFQQARSELRHDEACQDG